MARIRTIKPEFWTSEQIVECSRDARLMFVGMLNFCDDSGVHPASCKRLKMEVFPADDINSDSIRRLIDELLANDLITEYTVENKEFWRVTGWQHQKIDKPTYKFPLENGAIPTRGSRPLVEPSGTEGKGKGRGKDINTSLSQGEQVKTSFPESFIVGEQCMAKLHRAGLPIQGEVFNLELEKFKSHYKHKLSDDWQESFYRWMLNLKGFAKSTTVPRETKKSLSAVEQVKQANNIGEEKIIEQEVAGGAHN